MEMNARLEVSEAMQGKLDNCPLELEVSDNLYYKALLLKLQPRLLIVIVCRAKILQNTGLTRLSVTSQASCLLGW